MKLTRKPSVLGVGVARRVVMTDRFSTRIGRLHLSRAAAVLAAGLAAVTFSPARAAPAPGTWTPTGAMAEARGRHTATLLNDGTVLVAGGYGVVCIDPEFCPLISLGSAERYDPATGTWSAGIFGMAAGREAHTATLLNDGTVLVAGGVDVSAFFPPTVLASAERYDPATGTWSATGAMAEARGAHTATLLNDGTVLVSGGGNVLALASAERYDPATGTWSTTGAMAEARSSHTATLLNDGTVLAAGGCCASAERYDPATGTWSATGAMAEARGAHTATLLSDGTVLVSAGNGVPLVLASAELYDPANGTWSATGAMAMRRRYHTATLLNDGTVLVASGVSFTFLFAELYDPATGTWSATGAMAEAIPSHVATATLLNDGTVLVAGGDRDGLFPLSPIPVASAKLYGGPPPGSGSDRDHGLPRAATRPSSY